MNDLEQLSAPICGWFWSIDVVGTGEVKANANVLVVYRQEDRVFHSFSIAEVIYMDEEQNWA